MNRAIKLVYIEVLLILLVSIFNGYTFARYLNSEKYNIAYIADEFEIESNLLVTDGNSFPVYEIQKGLDVISFELHSRGLGNEVKYDINIYDSKMNIINKIDKQSLNVNETIILNDIEPGNYFIEVETCEPYKQNLGAYFNLENDADDLEWYVIDKPGNAMLELYITTEDSSGTIEVSWIEGLIPNTAINYLSEANRDTGKHEVFMEKYSTIKLEFFKDGTLLNTDLTQKNGEFAVEFRR